MIKAPQRGLPSTTEIWNYWWEFSEGHFSEDIPAKMIRGLFSLENTRWISSRYRNIWKECVKEGVRIFSLVPSPVTGQEALGTNWSTQSVVFLNIWSNILLWGWLCSGCPEKSWTFHAWKCSKALWPLLQAARGPAWERGWTQWPLEVPSNLNISVSCTLLGVKLTFSMIDWRQMLARLSYIYFVACPLISRLIIKKIFLPQKV